MSTARVRDAGDAALLVELEERIDPEVNARAIAIAGALQASRVRGVRDVVPGYRSAAIHFDPLATDVEALRKTVEDARAVAPAAMDRRTFEVPVVYGGDGGPDLAEVAGFAGISPDEVIARHAGVAYRVFVLGFLPGFPYMGLVDPRIAAPRRAVPRARVARGSVGIAGRQTGIYPQASPGGWQIIGRTPWRMFDPDRTPAALFQPGDEVRFKPTDIGDADDRPPAAERERSLQLTGDRWLTVLRPGLLTTVQDAGRWGHQASGVPVSGALDGVSHRIANALVGNDREAAAIEVTLAGPEIRVEDAATIAVAGADLDATLDGASLPLRTAVPCRAGSVLRFGVRRSGARAYIAFDGGIDVPPQLGSRSTHVLSRLGGLSGRALAAGDRLPLGRPRSAPRVRRVDLPSVSAEGGARVRVLPGPQDDFFPADAFDALERIRFQVGNQSDRMGYRLTGGTLPRLAGREMISDATFTGGLQVPPSGEPILLMADRQTTGGYPQIATVISADLPHVAQLAPGDWIEFRVCTRAEALAALVAQEGKLLALG